MERIAYPVEVSASYGARVLQVCPAHRRARDVRSGWAEQPSGKTTVEYAAVAMCHDAGTHERISMALLKSGGSCGYPGGEAFRVPRKEGRQWADRYNTAAEHHRHAHHCRGEIRGREDAGPEHDQQP